MKLYCFYRIERNLDGSQNKFVSKESSRDISDGDTGKETKAIIEDKPVETPAILKYIKTQVNVRFQSHQFNFMR